MQRFVLGCFSILLAFATPAVAHAQEVGLFASGGMVFTRGNSGLSDYFERGASFSIGATRQWMPYVHFVGRMDYAYLPSPEGAVAYYPSSGTLSDGNPAHLATASVGLRFRAREMAVTPYFEFDAGGALLSIDVEDPAVYRSGKFRRAGLELSVGTGLIRRLTPRLHLFVETRWVTTWGGGTLWTVPIRIGVERR